MPENKILFSNFAFSYFFTKHKTKQNNENLCFGCGLCNLTIVNSNWRILDEVETSVYLLNKWWNELGL